VEYLIENVIIDVDASLQQDFINNKDHMGETCLHEADKVHALSCIEILLKHNIDVNIVNNDGITSLHRAVDLGKC
jgi:ankyrin repeat protein